MATHDLPHPHEKYVVASALLTVAGLATALVYTVSSTPYTMVLFLGLGQMCIGLAMVFLVAVIALDVRARLQSVVERRFRAGGTTSPPTAAPPTPPRSWARAT